MSATIHIIDDDDCLRESLRAVLECYGFTVADHATGAGFLEGFSDDPGGSCLVLDMHMPAMDGMEVLARLRGPLRSQMPVVLVTGRGDRALRARALAAGADGFFEKPVDIDPLVTVLRRLTEGADRRE